MLNNPSTLDPPYIQDIYGKTIIEQVFDGLVKFSPDLFVVPALAENWQVEEEGKVYRFFLRKNARFHNGRQVTSKDVIFSLSRLLRVKPVFSILPHLLKINGAEDYMEYKTEEVAGLRAINDYTLVIRLDKSYVPLLVVLGMYQAKIVPAEEVLGREELFSQSPIGSGPFKFLSWQPNKAIHLQRFSDYYGGKPYLDGIEYIIYPGIQTEQVWADFQEGKLQEMPVYGQIREQMKARKDLLWVHRPSLSLLFYGINCQHSRLKNPELRKALSLAIDREALVSEIYNNQFEVARGILPPGLPGYQPMERQSAKDGDAVLHHLELARKDNPGPMEPIEIVSNSQSSTAKSELEFVRKAWARFGIELKTRFIPDWSAFEGYLDSQSMQVYRYAWFADLPDPDDFLRALFSSFSRYNYMGYKNKETDMELQKALGLIDPLERAKAYKYIEHKILESYPLIPLLHLSVDHVFQSTVQGIRVSALGAQTMSYQRVWLKPVDP